MKFIASCTVLDPPNCGGNEGAGAGALCYKCEGPRLSPRVSPRVSCPLEPVYPGG